MEQAFADVGDTDLKCLTREVFECVVGCVCDMIKFSLTGSGSCGACCCATQKLPSWGSQIFHCFQSVNVSISRDVKMP